MVNFATSSSSSSSSDSSQSNVHLLFTSSIGICEETLGKHVTLGKFLTLAAQLRNTTFISKMASSSAQVAAQALGALARIGAFVGIGATAVSSAMYDGTLSIVSLSGDFFPWGEKQMDRSLGLLLSLSSPFTKPFTLLFEED